MSETTFIDVLYSRKAALEAQRTAIDAQLTLLGELIADATDGRTTLGKRLRAPRTTVAGAATDGAAEPPLPDRHVAGGTQELGK
jgi:hypothetical protein